MTGVTSFTNKQFLSTERGAQKLSQWARRICPPAHASSLKLLIGYRLNFVLSSTPKIVGRI